MDAKPRARKVKAAKSKIAEIEPSHEVNDHEDAESLPKPEPPTPTEPEPSEDHESNKNARTPASSPCKKVKSPTKKRGVGMNIPDRGSLTTRAYGEKESYMVGSQRRFAVRTVGLLSGRMTLDLDFSRHVVRVLKGETSVDNAVRFEFDMRDLKALDKHSKTPPLVTILASARYLSSSSATYSSASSRVVKDTFCFETPYEKDEFCRLLHMAIMVGPNAYSTFKSNSDQAGMLNPFDLPPVLKCMVLGDVLEDCLVEELEQHQLSVRAERLDYCDYLVLLGEAFQALTEKGALLPKDICQVLDQPTIEVIPGEIPITRMNLAYREPAPTATHRLLGLIRGVFFLTNYKIVFLVYQRSARAKFRALQYNVELPIACVRKASANPSSMSLRLLMLDNRYVEIAFDTSVSWLNNVCDSINRSIVSLRFDPRNAFAHKHFQHLQQHTHSGRRGAWVDPFWRVYDPLAEYQRLQLTDNGWRLVNLHGASEMGFHVFAVPSIVSDEQLQAIAGYREAHKLPAVISLTITLARSNLLVSAHLLLFTRLYEVM